MWCPRHLLPDEQNLERTLVTPPWPRPGQGEMVLISQQWPGLWQLLKGVSHQGGGCKAWAEDGRTPLSIPLGSVCTVTHYEGPGPAHGAAGCAHRQGKGLGSGEQSHAHKYLDRKLPRNLRLKSVWVHRPQTAFINDQKPCPIKEP